MQQGADHAPGDHRRRSRRWRVLGSATVVLALMLGLPALAAPAGLQHLLGSNLPAGACTQGTVEGCSTPQSEAGSITGTVTNASGAGIAGVCVKVFPGGGPFSTSNDQLTDASGNFTIGGLPAGTYDVGYFPADGSGGCGTETSNSPDYAPAFYGGESSSGAAQPAVPTEAASTPVTVAVGAFSTASAELVQTGGSITGTVDFASGTAVPGVCVSANSGPEFGGPVAVATTGSDGSFTLAGLATGSVYVDVDPSCGFTTDSPGSGGWYAGSGTALVALGTTPVPASVSVTAGQPTSLGTLTLGKTPTLVGGAGSISGTVTSGGTGLSGACVVAVLAGANTVVSQTVTSSSGSYTINGLGFGSFDVFAGSGLGGSCGAAGFSAELGWYEASVTQSPQAQSSATPVVLSSSSDSESGIGLTISSLSSSVAGEVSGTIQGNYSAPAGDICVAATDYSTLLPPGIGQFQTTTSSSGSYSLLLPVGTATLTFDPSDSACGNPQSTNTTGVGILTTIVQVTAGSTTTENPTLPTAATISGSVSLPSAASGGTLTVAAYLPGSPTPLETVPVPLTSGATTVSYSLPFLPYSSSFDVAATLTLPSTSSQAGQQLTSWHASTGGAATEGAASSVAAGSGTSTSTSGVNLFFGSVSGTVTQPTGYDDSIEVVASNGQFGGNLILSASSFSASSSSSLPSASFSLVVPPGTTSFQFFDDGPAGELGAAASATVTSSSPAATVSPNPVEIQAGGKVVGEVTGASGFPAFGVCVELTSTSPGSSPGPYLGYSFPSLSPARTDTDYAIFGVPPGTYDLVFDPSCQSGFAPNYPDLGYPTQYYDSSLAPANPTISADATTIQVTAGQTITADDALSTLPAQPAPAASSPPSSSAPPSGPPTDTATSTSPTGTAQASAGGVSATATGEGTVTVVGGETTNPTGVALGDATGLFGDVHVSPGSTFTSVTVQVCDVGDGRSLDWFDATSGTWLPFSDQSPGPSGCLDATVTASTSPSIADLTGTPIAVVTSPPPSTGQAPSPSPTPTPVQVPTPGGHGYWLIGKDGGVFAFGSAKFYGSLPGLGVSVSDIVGAIPTPGGHGYWLIGQDGGVFAFGSARFYGSLPGLGISLSDIVGAIPTPDGHGYWLIGQDGGVFAFGDAPYLGSLPGLGVRVSDIVGAIPTPGGHGYWLIGKDGGVFAFGDAPYLGSLPGLGVSVSDVVAAISTPDGHGYWLVGKDGGVFAFGDAPYLGSLPGLGVRVSDIVGAIPTPGGHGYWLIGKDGGVFAFGDAPYLGSLPGLGVSVSDVAGGAG